MATSSRGLVSAVVLFVLGACRPESASVTRPEMNAAFAKPAAGGTTVEVSSVSPEMAPTDTVVDVVVNGKGFDRTAAAKWSIGGDTAQVHVLSTTYISSSQLRARLQVPALAAIGSYDVEVYLEGGKKGVGAELFAVFKRVSQTARSSTFTIPSSGANFTSVGGNNYVDGVCGVLARVFYLDPDFLDGNMQLDNPRTKSKACNSARKRITTYPATALRSARADTATGDMNISLLGSATETSGTIERPMNMSIAGSGVYCTRLAFGNDFGAPFGATKVRVTRIASTQWRVESPAGGASAACVRPSGQVELITGLVINFTVSIN